MDRTDLLSPTALLVGLVVVCLLALVVVGTTSSAAFGIFNSQWDGSSSIQSATESAGADSTVLLDTTDYDDRPPSQTVAFLIAPTQLYTEAELGRLREFVRDGGTLVIAEDYGTTGNTVLEGVGAESRFDGQMVRDMRYHGPTTAMPIATNVSDNFTTDADSVMLNYGTVVNETNGTTLVATSEFSYLTTTGTNQSNENHPFRSYPVVVSESIGNGTVIAVSDPSIFINAMQDRADNRAFTEELVTGHESVILDYSHADTQPPIRSALIRVRNSPAAQAGIGLAGLLLVGFMVHDTNPLWSRRRD